MDKPSYIKSEEFIERGLDMFTLREDLFKEIQEKGSHLKLLEIGCGMGRSLLELLEKFPDLELHGINLAPNHGIENREQFRVHAKEWNIVISKKSILPEIHFADAANLPFENNCFDIVISQVTFLHVKNKFKAIEEVCRVLKLGGLGLISAGAHSISLQPGHNMPKFYTSLENQIGDDLNPRFLIKDGERYLRFAEIIKLIQQQGYKIKSFSHEFTSKTQKARGYWIIIRKQTNVLAKFPFKYDSEESEKLTNKYSKLDPVNWGVIDIYYKK